METKLQVRRMMAEMIGEAEAAGQEMPQRMLVRLRTMEQVGPLAAGDINGVLMDIPFVLPRLELFTASQPWDFLQHGIFNSGSRRKAIDIQVVPATIPTSCALHSRFSKW